MNSVLGRFPSHTPPVLITAHRSVGVAPRESPGPAEWQRDTYCQLSPESPRPRAYTLVSAHVGCWFYVITVPSSVSSPSSLPLPLSLSFSVSSCLRREGRESFMLAFYLPCRRYLFIEWKRAVPRSNPQEKVISKPCYSRRDAPLI